MPTVPAVRAAVAPPQPIANANSSSGMEVSTDNIEIMLKRLPKNTKVKICSETADLVATYVSSRSSKIHVIRSELGIERDERNAQSDVVVSHVGNVMLRVGASKSESRAAQNSDVLTPKQ